jgi:hypothetical protein
MSDNNEENSDLFEEYTGGDSENPDESQESAPKSRGKPVKFQLPPERSAKFYKDFTKVNDFIRVFPQQCGSVSLKGSEKWGDSEAAMALDQCKMLTSASGAASTHRIAFKCGLEVVENKIAPMLRMDLHGLAELAGKDPSIMQALDECALLNDWNLQMTPEQRLMMGLGALIVRLDAVNKREAAVAEDDEPKKGPKVEDLQKEFDGL